MGKEDIWSKRWITPCKSNKIGWKRVYVAWMHSKITGRYSVVGEKLLLFAKV